MWSSRVALLLRLLVIVLISSACSWLPGPRAETPTNGGAALPSSSPPDVGSNNDNEAHWPDRRLIKQSDRAAPLDAYANDGAASIIPTRLLKRPDLLVERSRLRTLGDVAGVARLNAVLSTEA